MDKPVILNQILSPLYVQEYERYLPTAFDDSLTILEKLNKVIITLNQIGQLSNDVLDQWNTVMDWVMSDGLNDSVNAVLQAMEADGTLAKIINIDILNAKADKTYVDDQITTLSNTLTNEITTTTESINTINTSLGNKADLTDFTQLQNDFTNSQSHRFINAMFPPSPLVAAKGDGITDDSDAINAMVALQRPILFPEGTYRLAKTVKIGAFNFVGMGINTKFDIDNCDAFEIFDEGGRKVVEIGNFIVISTKDNCANHVAFKSTQYTGSANAINYRRTVGAKFFNIEIGGGGTFGAGFQIYDMFRLSIDHVGMTDCLNGIILEGQVVQASLFEVTCNTNTRPPKSTTVNSGLMNGLSLNYSNHTGENVCPESIKVINCSFVGHQWGVYQNGCLFSSYHGLDLDYCQSGGIRLGAAAGGCYVRDSWIAMEGSGKPTYGIYVALSDFDRNMIVFDGCHISFLIGTDPNSKGVYQEQYRKSVTYQNCTVRGAQILNGFHIASPVEMNFLNNMVWDGIATDDEIKIDDASQCIVNYNRAHRVTVNTTASSWNEVRSNRTDVLVTGGSGTVVS